MCCDVDLDFIRNPSPSISPTPSQQNQQLLQSSPPSSSSSLNGSGDRTSPANTPFIMTKEKYDQLHDILQNLMDTPFYIFHNKIKRIIQVYILFIICLFIICLFIYLN